MTEQSAGDGYPYLSELVAHLDTTLQCSHFHKIDGALNGLQVGDMHRSIRSIAAAVDASLESFERAADLSTDLLIVHHGIFWGQHQGAIGLQYRRLASLVEKKLGLYAAHLPLDAHGDYGNNAHLARCLGLRNLQPFAWYKGVHLGCGGELAEPGDLDDICHLLGLPEQVLRLDFGRRAQIQRIAIVSGAGGLAIEEAAEQGYDLLLTGEIGHQHYHAAREQDINILAIGHYRSETGGVQHLLNMLKQQWPCLSTNFIDLPTGL